MQSVGSCLFVFFVFLVFCFFVFLFFGLCVDSHCRCAKQRLPGTVSGCTRSKVDTLQYSNVCYDIVHSANEQQRGMEFNFVRLRHMLLDLCTGNAAICALPWWPVLKFNMCRVVTAESRRRHTRRKTSWSRRSSCCSISYFVVRMDRRLFRGLRNMVAFRPISSLAMEINSLIPTTGLASLSTFWSVSFSRLIFTAAR